MGRARTFKLTEARLRRLADGTSIRALARELDVSDYAVRQRLKDPAVAAKLDALRGDPGPGSPSPTPTPKAKATTRPSKPSESAAPVVAQGSSPSGRLMTRSGSRFTSHAPGDGMRIGFSRRDREVDEMPRAVRNTGGAAGLTRHETVGLWFDPDDPGDVKRVERLSAVLGDAA